MIRCLLIGIHKLQSKCWAPFRDAVFLQNISKLILKYFNFYRVKQFNYSLGRPRLVFRFALIKILLMSWSSVKTFEIWKYFLIIVGSQFDIGSRHKFRILVISTLTCKSSLQHKLAHSASSLYHLSAFFVFIETERVKSFNFCGFVV